MEIRNLDHRKLICPKIIMCDIHERGVLHILVKHVAGHLTTITFYPINVWIVNSNTYLVKWVRCIGFITLQLMGSMKGKQHLSQTLNLKWEKSKNIIVASSPSNQVDIALA